MDPRLEAIGLPQMRQPAPGEDEGVLQRVLGETRIAQDPLGDREQRFADLVHQDGERVAIARRACSTRSRSIVASGSPPRRARTTHYDGRPRSERSVRSRWYLVRSKGADCSMVGNKGRAVQKIVWSSDGGTVARS